MTTDDEVRWLRLDVLVDAAREVAKRWDARVAVTLFPADDTFRITFSSRGRPTAPYVEMTPLSSLCTTDWEIGGKRKLESDIEESCDETLRESWGKG